MTFSLPRCIRLGATLALALVAWRPTPLVAQDSTRTEGARKTAAPKRDLPLTPARTVSFTTDEGTWISLDVSPDGRTIVFDLVGDLYTLPIAGGQATRISDGPALDNQPRFSPDGKSIVFVSDRSGAENVWIADADGKNPRALTKGDKAQYISPDWTPDGNYIVVSTSKAGILGSTYDLVMIHRDGGSGIKLTGQGTGAPNAAPPGPFNPPPYDNYLGAAFGNDPRYIFAAVKRGGFGYNLQLPLWQVAAYDRETGKTYVRTNAYGSAMRPIVSPDGKYLVYATRVDTATALRLRNLETGDEQFLAMAVQRDDQESRFTRDLMPGAAFTPDGRALVLSYGGKIWKLDVPGGRATPIPFTAEVKQEIGPLVSFEYTVNDTTLTVRQIRGARPSPDGKRLAFTALDKLWVMDLPSGKPKRLTTANEGEHSPAWSPDGRYIAFVTWTEKGGDIYRVRADGKGKPERLTRQVAFYEDLTYTPDGKTLVVKRGPAQPRIEEEFLYGFELVSLPAGGGEITSITPINFAGMPHFTRDGKRLYIYDPADGLVSMRFDGTDRKPVLKVTGYQQPGGGPNARPDPADEILISPDGDRAVAVVGTSVYMMTVPYTGGATPTISAVNPNSSPVPLKRVSRIGGDWPGWSADGKRFYYSLGHSFFTYDVGVADSLVRDSTARADSAKRAAGTGADSAAARTAGGRADTAQAGRRPAENISLTPGDSAKVAKSDSANKHKVAYEPSRVDVLITVRSDKPSGTIALRGARIITMKGNEVIENGDVLVRDNRIAAVGPKGSVTIPAGTREIDVTGKTIMPGWVDIHAHLRPSFGIHKAQVWEYMVNLAYGVTTTRDPQTGTTDVLSYGDLVETGDMLGPRIFSTGPGVFWTDDISSLDDARDVLRRYSDYYNTYTIKQYMVGDRKVRQWVIMAAKELGLKPTTEGGLDMKMSITEMLDGYPGHEHSYPIVPLYKDIVQLAAQSGIVYTPTLLVVYGGPWTENYFYEKESIHTDAKLRRFTPHTEIDRRTLRRPGWFAEDQYIFPKVAESAARVVQAGGKVGLGGHGQLQGLGVHWELWAIASGGMPAMEVLRVGTANGAEAIGLGKELGSLESGKLADLQVLDANPLENIRNTTRIRYVMKNGRLYEAETLTEIWPRQKPIEQPWWQQKEPIVAAEGQR